ncbi:hypothetical protein BJX64DRAFT_299080 [Aspergillus heterothallicus]
MAFNNIRPVFSLVDQEGQAFTNSDLHGKYSLVFFGFTNCAVVCPRALKRLSDVLADPARDTPGVMKNFITKRFPQFTGLTGTKEQIDSARKEFHVFAKAKHDANALGGYVVPHTAITYLLDMEGCIVDHFNDVLNAKVVTTRVLKKIKSGPDAPSKVPETPSAGKIEYEQESLNRLDAKQLKGDWANMMGASDLNDGFGAYRYQLAFMYFALFLAHYHRLPAAPGYFRDTMERMIQKMLEPDVWFYWHDASTGGGAMHTPPKPMLFDPIETDNIMYSAYLQVMTNMYNSLFDDDRYQEPGALTFKYNVFLWGPAEGYKFEWDQNKVNDQIYRNMVKEGYMGVACEPWCIYQVCNQVPILGFRLNDALKEDSDVAGEVTKGYVEAWESKGNGIITEQGVFNTFYMTHLNIPVAVPGGSGEAWTGFLMNAWNHELVRKNYESRLEELLFPKPDGSLSVNVGPLDEMEQNQLYLASGGVWGWIAAWATEMGDDETRDRLLSYADKYFNPRIQNGGLMYPRNDTIWDKDHNYVMVSPILSNAILPLTRLNVRHGLKRLYENPWGAKNRDHYDEPALSEVDFSVDVYRAVYIASSRTLLFDVAIFEHGAQGSVVLGNVFGRGNWTLSRDGHEIARGTSDALSEPEKGFPRLKQEGDKLRLSVTGTKVVSYDLKWDA